MARNTVDLDETVRVIEKLIQAGVSGLITLGTTGECATLAEEDYNAFVACVLETVRKRIPTIVGTTPLGSHQVATRMELIKDLGADATLLGLPICARSPCTHGDFSQDV